MKFMPFLFNLGAVGSNILSVQHRITMNFEMNITYMKVLSACIFE